MKLPLVSILFLFSICSGAIAQNNKYQEIDSLINEKSILDAMTALDLLKQNHQKDTTTAEYWLRYAKASYAYDEYKDAISAIDKAIQIDPKNSLYYFEKGCILNSLANVDIDFLDAALQSLDQAIKIKPKGEYYYWKGIVNQQLNKPKDAEKDYKAALKDGFEAPELYSNYSIILLQNAQCQEALIQINKAIALKNELGHLYFMRSKIYLCLLNVDSACLDNDRAYDLGYMNAFTFPDSVCQGFYAPKWKFLAKVFAINQLYPQSINAYTNLIDSNYLNGDFFLDRGYCYFKLNDYEKAEKDYLKALEFSDVSLDLLYDNLSLLYYEKNNLLKSIEYISKRIQLNPNNHVPYIDRGLCYRKLKKYAEAEADFNKSLEINPYFFRAFGYRSFLFMELGRYQEAFDDAAQAIAINPKYGYGYLILAQAKQQLGLTDFCDDWYKAKKYGEPEAEEGIRLNCK